MNFEASTATLSPFIDPAPWKEFYYGFRVNIRNPYAHTLYERYRKKKGIPRHYPMSDEERFEFELFVIPVLEKRFKTKAPKPYIPLKMRNKLPIDLLKQIYGVTGMGCVDELLEKVKESDRQFAPQDEAADDAENFKEDFEEIEKSAKK